MTTRPLNLIDAQEIRRAWQLLIEPGQVVELRVLEASIERNARFTNTLAGYFDNVDDLLKAAAQVQAALGFYTTMQPCYPDLLHRAKNKLIKQKRDYSTPDNLIEKYRWLLIDCDPERISHISSTDEEHKKAQALSRDIRQELTVQGWPEPIDADSGNGFHLRYHIDLPTTRADLIKHVLEGLAARFNIPGISIDTTVYNPARICKLYGTLACKGDNTRERPYRLSRIIDAPDELQPVPLALLEVIATSAPTVAAPPSKHENLPGDVFDMEGFISKHHINTYDRQPYQGGYKWILKQCPFCQESDRGACLFITPSGAAAFRCQHNRCSGKDWRDLRTYYEPDAYTRSAHGKTQRTQEYKPGPPALLAASNGNGNGHHSAVIDLCSFDADDAGNSDAMNALYGQEFLYCPARGWFHHNKTHWELDPDGSEVKKCAIETLRSRRHAAVDAGVEAIIKCTKADEKRVNSCVNLFKTHISVSIDEFDSNPDELNFKNGVVDLRTGQIEPHDRKQRFTYCLPVEYERCDYTEWMDYQKGVVGGGQEVLDYLQMAAGYSLTGHTREEILFYLFGPTRSGKGTWAETFMALLPTPISKMVDFNSFTAKRDGDVSNFDLAPLKPARMIFASESNRSQSLNPAKIKQLTGGDHISACFKHKDFFSYRPQFKVWMLSNHQVNGDPEDDALWGRVRVIEFPNSFLGREDKTKKAHLKEPEVLKGIAYWAVQGAIKWYALGAKGLTTPSSVEATTQKHRDELDFVQQWLDECCDDDDEGWTANEDVIASYTEWCKNNNVQYLKGPKALAQSLKAKGYKPGQVRKIEGKAKRGVAGLYIYRTKKVTVTDVTDDS